MSSKDIYSGPRVKDLETFIEKAQFVHGDTYGYDKSNYVGSKSKVTINCNIHGDFQQTPSSHLQGHGCSSCKFDSEKSNTEDFIQKAQFVHDSKYSYEKTEYVNSRSNITINCPVHGDFQQTPNSHLIGNGCSRCFQDSNRSNTEEFIQKAKSVHGDTYGYGKVEYTGWNHKITITCPKHGVFEQSPSTHLSGSGCPNCAHESLPGRYDSNKEEYKTKDAIFYHVRFTIKETDEAFEKFGVTKKSVTRRFNQITKDHDLKLEIINEYHTTLYEAIELEQDIKEYLNENDLAYRIHTLKQFKIPGWTECFRCGELDMLFNW